MIEAKIIDGKTEVQLYEQWRADLKNARTTYDANGKEISEYLIPRAGDWTEDGDNRQEGEKRNTSVYDGAPYRAVRTAAAGIRAGITPPSRPWFKIAPAGDPELGNYGPVRRVLDSISETMQQLLPAGGFYEAGYRASIEMLGFGSSCTMAEQDDETVARWKNVTAGRYWISRNWKGDIDTLFRVFRPAVKALAERFGKDNLSDSSQRLLENQPFKKALAVHVVTPNTEREPGYIDNLNMPFKSCYYEVGLNDRVLRRGGYQTFPYQFATFDRLGDEDYGRGPGQDAIADVKLLYEYAKTAIKQQHMVSDPPVVVPEQFQGRLNLLPGGITYGPSDPKNGIRALYDVNPDLKALWVAIQDLREMIGKSFFNDLFIFLMNNPNATATEIIKRDEEKVILLGPLVDGLGTQRLSPSLQRLADLMAMAGMLPPLPPELQDMPLRVEYTSPLVQAQKMAGITNMDMLVESTLTVAERGYPEAMDNIDLDLWVQEKGQRMGGAVNILRDSDEVTKRREARAQMQAQQQKQESALAAIQAAKELSQADTQGKNALTDLAAVGNA